MTNGFGSHLYNSPWFGDWVWWQADGQPRALKPSRFDNPVSSVLNHSLFTGPSKLRTWQRVLLALGF